MYSMFAVPAVAAPLHGWQVLGDELSDVSHLLITGRVHHPSVRLELYVAGKLLDDLAGNLAKLVRYYGITVTVALQDGGARVANGGLRELIPKRQPAGQAHHPRQALGVREGGIKGQCSPLTEAPQQDALVGDASPHLLLYQGVDAVPGTLDAAAVLWPIHIQGLEVKP